jgi:hypothetical protein
MGDLTPRALIVSPISAMLSGEKPGLSAVRGWCGSSSIRSSGSSCGPPPPAFGGLWVVQEARKVAQAVQAQPGRLWLLWGLLLLLGVGLGAHCAISIFVNT